MTTTSLTHRICAWIRTTVAVVGALIAATVRRLLRGPLVPSWSWQVELWRAGFAAALGAAMRMTPPEQWSRMMPAGRLSRDLARLVEVATGSVGGIPGEWVRTVGQPRTPAAVLYLHGGGYVVGSASSERPLVAATTVAIQAETFAADYRLAPEHRFPAALEDAAAAYHGLLSSGRHAEDIIVAGDSAGGGLAIALLVSLRDRRLPLPAGAVVFSPWVDLTNSGGSIAANAATDYLSGMPHRGRPLYLGDADPTDPLVSPLFADLTGLPPLLILAGGREMLLDDAIRLAIRARDCGVAATLHIEADMFHVWPVILPNHPASLRAFNVVGRWATRLMSVRR